VQTCKYVLEHIPKNKRYSPSNKQFYCAVGYFLKKSGFRVHLYEAPIIHHITGNKQVCMVVNNVDFKLYTTDRGYGDERRYLSTDVNLSVREYASRVKECRRQHPESYDGNYTAVLPTTSHIHATLEANNA